VPTEAPVPVVPAVAVEPAVPVVPAVAFAPAVPVVPAVALAPALPVDVPATSPTVPTQAPPATSASHETVNKARFITCTSTGPRLGSNRRLGHYRSAAIKKTTLIPGLEKSACRRQKNEPKKQ
jgi:hypothetical protein